MSTLPKGWNLLLLNQICDLQNGYAFKSNDYVNVSNTLNCRMSNIRPNGVFDLEHNQKFLPDSYTEKYKQYLLKDGDVIIAMTDMATEAKILGVPTIVETQGKKLLLNQRVGKLIIKKPELIYFPYLKYVLNREQVKKYFLKFAGGGLQINLGKEDILSVKIPIPPLEEQKRIAEILDRSQFLISKRQEAIAQLNIFTQAIFIDMFGDPVINPKGWTIEKLGKLGTLDRGISKHRPRNAPELLGGIYPLVQTGDVANSGGYIRHYKNTYSEVGLRQSKMWKTGTLCITIAANIAKTGILTFDACFPDSIVGFLAKDFATIEFVRVWLSFIQKTLEETAPESAQKNINLGTLRDLSIPFPPLPLQQEFAQRVEAVEKLKATHRESLSELQELFASLQHRAVRGEL